MTAQTPAASAPHGCPAAPPSAAAPAACPAIPPSATSTGAGPGIDDFGRRIDYLRIAITDRCNYRCVYCMPASGVHLMTHDRVLSFEQIEHFVRIGAELGIRHLRLTGGEPLARKGCVRLAAMLKAIQIGRAHV